MIKFSKLIITLFGIGTSPIAPGTIGSFISLIFFIIFNQYFSTVVILIIFILITLISLKLISIYSQNTENHDASEIIIDEFIGINFIFIFYEYIVFENKLLFFSAIFISFRFFDIIKVFPANWVDKNIKNSFGVVLDDLIAAFYCVIILYLINAFI